MRYVFVSYVRENQAQVDKLVAELQDRGISCWLDRFEILPGQRWKNAIRSAISRGAFFVACFSKDYEQKTKTYMNEELVLAIDELRQRPTDRVWFIPIKLTDCSIPDRPIGAGETLRSIQWIDLYTDWSSGIKKIVSVIEKTAISSVHPNDDTISPAYAKAIDQLGNPSRSVRIGGIYALEKIAHDSIMDHWPIMRIIASYVRDNAQKKSKYTAEELLYQKPPDDILAALDTLCRRVPGRQEGVLDLSNTFLAGADFSQGVYQGANFEYSVLVEARLSGSDIRNANFFGADLELASLCRVKGSKSCLEGSNLEGADISDADLRGANLMGSVVKHAKLHGANLRGVIFSGATLEGANLSRADLTDADLGSVHLEDTIFKGAKLRQASFRGASCLTRSQLESAADLTADAIEQALSEAEHSLQKRAKHSKYDDIPF